jgi:hypothetical protein
MLPAQAWARLMIFPYQPSSRDSDLLLLASDQPVPSARILHRPLAVVAIVTQLVMQRWQATPSSAVLGDGSGRRSRTARVQPGGHRSSIMQVTGYNVAWEVPATDRVCPSIGYVTGISVDLGALPGAECQN